MLRAEHITVNYGPVRAVTDVSFSINAGQVLAVLGPNGAGKTSLLRAVSGLEPHDGTITVDDGAHVAHVPQGRGLFRKLTVAQNIALGARGNRRERKDGTDAAIERIHELRFWWSRRVGSLSGGEQVLVALGRLLAARPDYALIDELSLGLAPIARDRVEAEIERLASDGVGIVLVDQHAPRALALAQRVLVLDHGAAVISGPARSANADRIARLTVGVNG